jgi:lipopolysaccharide transport system ATP-binding protein
VTGALEKEDVYLHRILDIHMFRVSPNLDNLGTAIVNFNCSPGIECIK